MTPHQKEALEALEKHGSQVKAARALGIRRSTFQERLRRAYKHMEADPAIKGAMAEVGMQDAGVLHSGWIKSDGASMYFKMPQKDADPEDIVAQIKEALSDLEAAPTVQKPTVANEDLLTLYPIPDAHLGMYAYGEETGENYDADIAKDRILRGIGQCMASTPPSAEAVIVAMGDLLHADDQSNQTPSSKHQLDVDTRHFRNLDIAITTLASAVEAALRKHNKVDVVVQPGNHDLTAYMAVLFALSERYRENPRVSVQRKPGEFFVREFGKCLIASHHGDKAKPDRLVMFMADQWAEMWGRTKYRFLFTGHLHHTKSQDIGGCQWEQLRAISARDAYATAHAYTARAEMQAITYERDRGEVSRVKVAL
jgi:lambda repressor-like predicted transcriptional regulator